MAHTREWSPWKPWCPICTAFSNFSNHVYEGTMLVVIESLDVAPTPAVYRRRRKAERWLPPYLTAMLIQSMAIASSHRACESGPASIMSKLS